MKSWVKLYTEINRDPKMAQLTWAHKGIWAALLALAGELDLRNGDGSESGELDTVENTGWHLRCDLETLTPALQAFTERDMVTTTKGILRVSHWQRYLSQANRPQSAVAAWRAAVLGRDGHTCQRCGTIGEKLNAHHIKAWFAHPRLRYDINNGVTLCVPCHKKQHRTGWKRIYAGAIV